MRNERFEQEFLQAFDGRFRIRWSDKRHEYHIEQRLQKSNPHLIPPVYKDPETFHETYDTYSDEWIRARDGYFFVLAIRPGNTMPCPVCGLTVDVPELITAESHCPFCKVMGRDARYIAAYFPLNHILIEHMRTLDPYTNGPAQSRKRIREQQLTKQDREQKAALDEADAMVRFNNNQVMNVPMSGSGSRKTVQHDDGSRLEVDRLFK